LTLHLFIRIAEERQDQNAKRRKVENQIKNGNAAPSPALGLFGPTSPVHPSLPPRPDFAAKADSIGLGAAVTAESLQMAPLAAQALAGSNRDVVANRRAIRMANMSAAEVLRAELSGLQPVKPSASSLPAKPVAATVTATHIVAQLPAKPLTVLNESSASAVFPVNGSMAQTEDLEVDEFGRMRRTEPDDDAVAGRKRTFEEGPGAVDVDEDVAIEENDEDEAPPEADADALAYKVNADGTVTQEDTVK
jgi:5'-3' exoribonuclease 2